MKKKKNMNINPLITHNNPKSVISEKFRGIRTNIMFSTANDDVKTLVVTSEQPTVGKSLVSANIAIAYAQSGYKTLLIDGDMRKPTQHYFFDVLNVDGLSNLIINKSHIKKAIHETEVPNLNMISSGPIPPNPSELIGSTQFQMLLEDLNEVYDFIVIDTPPVNTVTDAQLFSEIAGYSVLVINVEKNDRNNVLKSKELIEKTGAKVLGVILNRTEQDNNSSYYSYYGDESQ